MLLELHPVSLIAIQNACEVLHYNLTLKQKCTSQAESHRKRAPLVRQMGDIGGMASTAYIFAKQQLQALHDLRYPR